MACEPELTRGVLTLSSPLPLHLGGELPPPDLAWEVVGPPGAPLVAVQGGISAGSHLASSAGDGRRGWWEGFVGPGLALDTRRWRVLGIDYLGGAGESTGPGREPGDLGTTFPRITSHDQASATVRLLEELDLGRLHAFVGASYGGMVGLALAVLAPRLLDRLVVISAAHDAHPWAQSLRAIQRRLLRFGVETGSPRQGVVLARALAMVTYRSPEEFRERFATTPVADQEWVTFPVEEYLLARGEAFADDFNPAAFHILSRAIDLHRVLPEEIKVPTTLVASDTDRLVPREQMAELAGRLGGPVAFEVIQSLVGHDAFLKEREQLGPILERALSLS